MVRITSVRSDSPFVAAKSPNRVYRHHCAVVVVTLLKVVSTNVQTRHPLASLFLVLLHQIYLNLLLGPDLDAVLVNQATIDHVDPEYLTKAMEAMSWAPRSDHDPLLLADGSRLSHDNQEGSVVLSMNRRRVQIWQLLWLRSDLLSPFHMNGRVMHSDIRIRTHTQRVVRVRKLQCMVIHGLHA